MSASLDADLSIAAMAALVGKRAPARMLPSQMDGREHAAKELAYRHHHFRIAVGPDRALDGPLGPVVVGGPK